MYLLIIYLPFMGALVAGLGSYWIGKKGAIVISNFCIFLTFLLSCFIFYEIALSQTKVSLPVFSWFDVDILKISWTFYFDAVTSVMLIVITSVSCLVHLYSVSYMSEDAHLPRFLSYLSIFTLFMLFLVTANNFFQLFLGWEGVGVASYLLINFWYTRLQANKSALKAVIVNRIGDLGLALAIGFSYLTFKTVEFPTIFLVSPNIKILEEVNFGLFKELEIFGTFSILDLICLMLFLGAVGKSAQIGLHTWLPDAMEGPTPVSALIHAATMVTAGVFLLIRCSPLLELSGNILTIITIVGAITSFFAATVGLVQNDLKKVIAYSTCSQLGYMIFICGLSYYSLSLFHLMNHAFFKALLFLSAGSVIHAMSDEQDMRKLGGLVKLLPFTYVMILIGSLALMGFPFLTGFYSKDVILEFAYLSRSSESPSFFIWEAGFAYFLGLMAAACTAFYSFRLISLTFYCETNAYKASIKNIHELDSIMAFVLGILCLGSIFVGYVFKDMFIGAGTDFWNGSIASYNSYSATLYIKAEFLPFYIKNLPFLLSIFSASLSYYVFYLAENSYIFKKVTNLGRDYKLDYNLNRYELYIFLSRKWYFDYIYNKWIVKPVLRFGYFNFKIIDRGLLEILGPLGLVRGISKMSDNLSRKQNSSIYHYGLILITALCFSLLYFNDILLIEIFELNQNLLKASKYFVIFLILGLYIFIFSDTTYYNYVPVVINYLSQYKLYNILIKFFKRFM